MRTKILALAALVIGFSSLSLYSQTSPRVAVVDTDAFNDPKAGIKRLTVAFQQLDTEFKGRKDELAQLQSRYDQLVKEINDLRLKASEDTLRAKSEQAETLKTDIERKSADGQKAVDKRAHELTDAIYAGVENALKVFAKGRGYDVVFDVSKMSGAVMVVNDGIDITEAFIADYNTKNPVPAPTKP